MKHEDAPESTIAHPKKGFMRMVLFELGALQIGDVEKYILRGDTLSTE